MIHNNFKLTLIWFFGSCIGFYFASMHLEAAISGDSIAPFGPDSFSHAKRILNLLETGELIQFDPLVNSPHGAYVPWPWAYDSLIAIITYVASIVFLNTSFLEIIVRLPPFIIFLNGALVVVLCKVLRLPPIFALMAMLCFSLSPLTQDLHFIGRIDHHMIEFSFVIGSLILGVLYFNNNYSKKTAIAYGVLLGLAPAFHNGLFILQLPLLLTLFLLWVLRIKLNGSLIHFCFSLLSTTFLFLLFSEPFREGYFNFYYHSWFHLYIALCVSFMTTCFYLVKFNKVNLTIMIIVSLLLAFPVVSDLTGGFQFVSTGNSIYSSIQEFARPISWKHSDNLIPKVRLHFYTGLLLVLPITISIFIFWGVSQKKPHIYFFVISSVFGVVLLLAQYRLNYFGSFSLYMPLLLICNDLSEKYKNRRNIIIGYLILVIFAFYYPVKNVLLRERALSGSYGYELSYKVLNELGESCKHEPGTVLATWDDGHYITFHTSCSVIASNFIITPLDFDRVKFSTKMLSSRPEDILQTKLIDYVFVRRRDDFWNYKTADDVKKINDLLVSELLFSNYYPENYKLIAKADYSYDNGEMQPYAKVFKIKRKHE